MKDCFGSEYIPPDKVGRVRDSADRLVDVAHLPLSLAGPGDQLCLVCKRRFDAVLWFKRDGCGWGGDDRRPWSGGLPVCLDCVLYLCDIEWGERTLAYSPDYDVRGYEPHLSRILHEWCNRQRGAV
jgi:hypothetical protein